MRRGFALAIGLTMCLESGAPAQESANVVRGTWAATSGTGLAFRGAWSAQPHPEVAGAVYGSWAIFDKANRPVLQGTWSAEKDAGGWQGVWSARTPSDRVYSGTWRAALEDMKGGTLMQMLERTLTSQVSGTWRYGPLTGSWWLGN